MSECPHTGNADKCTCHPDCGCAPPVSNIPPEEHLTEAISDLESVDQWQGFIQSAIDHIKMAQKQLGMK